MTEQPNFRTSVLQLERPGDSSVFGAQVHADAAAVIARYPEGQSRSALLPLLHLVQSEQGQVTADGIAFCAEHLNLTKAQVAAVVTFYTMYKRSPTGEYLVSVCTNTLCGMLGGDEILAVLEDMLGLGHGGADTTPDGKITLEHAECLAACDYAPVVTVNYEFFDNQTVGTARNLVSQLQNGDRPSPTRGAPLCTFKQIERQIAGFFDDESAAQDANGSGVPTEVGVKLAIERGDTAPSYSTTGAEAEPVAAAQAAPANAAPAKAAPAKKAPARTARKAPAKAASEPPASDQLASDQPTSAHDAPLTTAESDGDAPATGTSKGE